MTKKNTDSSSSASKDFSDRVIVFKELTLDQVTSDINNLIFENLLDRYYDEFIELCDGLKGREDEISSVSCYIDNGAISFDVKHK